MKNQKQVEKEFDHSKTNMIEACKLTEQQVSDLVDGMNEVIQQKDTLSEVIEEMTSKASKKELAFLVIKTQHDMNEELEKAHKLLKIAAMAAQL